MVENTQSSYGSEKVISEVYGKHLLNRIVLKQDANHGAVRCLSVNASTEWGELTEQHPWLKTERLVVKPDQSIKRRNQYGLVQLDVNYETARQWIETSLGSAIQIDGIEGRLKQFLVEPFLPHNQNEEFYVAVYSMSESQDVVLFHSEGGVDIGNVEEKALRSPFGIKEFPKRAQILSLLRGLSDLKQQMLCDFILSLIECFRDLHFTYLEINPLVVTDSEIHILDVAAKLDSKAAPLCNEKWGRVQYAPSTCRDPLPEEAHISWLEGNTPCSLALTVLNRKGRIWSWIWGAGSSVVVGDVVVELGAPEELAIYTQVSGRASGHQVSEFIQTLIDLMTQDGPHPKGKTLILGNSSNDILNVIKMKLEQITAVIDTLQNNKEKLQANKISLIIRRFDVKPFPTNQLPEELKQLGIPIHVFSSTVPLRRLVEFALGMSNASEEQPEESRCSLQPSLLSSQTMTSHPPEKMEDNDVADVDEIFNQDTRAIVVGLMGKSSIQHMLDFDFVCGRKTPSVAAAVDPEGRDHEVKEDYYRWAEGKTMIPVYSSLEDALAYHPDASVVVNSVYGRHAMNIATTAIKSIQIRCILMMVGHIPEQQTRHLIQLAKNNTTLMIGPCTPKHVLQVGVVKAGCFRCNKLGNIGGGLSDVIALRLYRPGSVGFVTCSGGLSMDLIVEIAKNTDGLYQGITIGGGRFMGSNFLDHMMLLEANPGVKILLLLGEFGGQQEFPVCEALRSGRITKPVVAFCIGSCADLLKTKPGVFGHCVGNCNVSSETSPAKNEALEKAGALVPKTFSEIGEKLREVYTCLVSEGKLVPCPEPPVPTIPASYNI